MADIEYWVITRGWYEDQRVVGIVTSLKEAEELYAKSSANNDPRWEHIGYHGPIHTLGKVLRHGENLLSDQPGFWTPERTDTHGRD